MSRAPVEGQHDATNEGSHVHVEGRWRDVLHIVVVGEPELICILRGLLLRTCWWNSFCRPTVTAPLVTCAASALCLNLVRLRGPCS